MTEIVRYGSLVRYTGWKNVRNDNVKAVAFLVMGNHCQVISSMTV
jgi:hypothetical protein